MPIAAARHREPPLAPPDGRSAAVTLLFPARAAVIVGGVPGAGKTTLLERVATQGGACVLDSAAVRVRLRKRLGPRVPYALFRPLVHVLHQLAVWRALGSDGSDAVVVHDCATRRWLRRLMLWRAHRGGRPVVLLALDTDAGQARAGQRARGRRVRDAVMRRHERHWSELLGADDDRAPGERLRREGFARVHVLDRSAADAVTALRFAPPIRQDPFMASGDDDDWVGTPPEGRHSRDRAKPEFWRDQRPIVPAAVGIAVVVLVILVVALLG